MIVADELLAFAKEDLPEVAKTLKEDDITQLIEWLNTKDDKLRYHALLLLEHRAEDYGDVYPYWNLFWEKLKSPNSYQRSIGVMLIAANAKWDNEDKMSFTIGDYLEVLWDEKPITVRQCIQALSKIITHKPNLQDKVSRELMAIDVMKVKPTMRKLILMDILNILVLIQKSQSSKEIEAYISPILTGGLLDKKVLKQIGFML